MRRLLAVIALTSLAVALGAPACSNQGEGGQCNTQDGNNGDDDCSDGLECYAAAAIGGVYATYGDGIQGFGYCCPTNRADATTATCALPASVPNGNSGLPDGGPDSGSVSTTDGSTDAPADAPSAVDAPVDSPADAPVDAPADSPVPAVDSSVDAPTD